MKKYNLLTVTFISALLMPGLLLTGCTTGGRATRSAQAPLPKPPSAVNAVGPATSMPTHGGGEIIGGFKLTPSGNVVRQLSARETEELLRKDRAKRR